MMKSGSALALSSIMEFLEFNYEFLMREMKSAQPLIPALFSKRWKLIALKRASGIESHYYRLSVKLMTLENHV